MRFDKETRAAIYEAAPDPATFRWPSGAGEPEKGGIYYLQSLEDAKEAEEKAKRRREYSPPTHADVLAHMHEHFYKQKPPGYKPPPRRRTARRPRKGDPCIRVLSVTILERGWEVKAALFEDPDPVRHTGIKAKVPAGPNPIDRFHEPTELEPEGIVLPQSRREREEEEEALKVEHAASVDQAEVFRAERRLKEQRRKGKPGKLAAAALERARRRADRLSADAPG